MIEGVRLRPVESIKLDDKVIPYSIVEEVLMKYVKKWLYSIARTKDISISSYLGFYEEEFKKEILDEYGKSITN